jgi:hypothetical protein
VVARARRGVVGVVGWSSRARSASATTTSSDRGRAIAGAALLALVVLKFVSWSISLGSGTSGGTLAPLFTIGGGSARLGGLALAFSPRRGVEVRASRRWSAWPRCSPGRRTRCSPRWCSPSRPRGSRWAAAAARGVQRVVPRDAAAQRQSIMTERRAAARHAVRTDYELGLPERACRCGTVATRIRYDRRRAVPRLGPWVVWTDGADGADHQGFPVVEATGALVGVVTRARPVGGEDTGLAPVRSTLRRGPARDFGDNTLREAADHMVREGRGGSWSSSARDRRASWASWRAAICSARTSSLRAHERAERSFGRAAS